MKNALVTWMTFAFLLLWAGPLTGATPESAEKRPPGTEEKASVEEDEEIPYRYDPKGKTDPFDPFIVKKTRDLSQIREGDPAGEELRKMLAILEDLKKPKTELQTIPLSAIQLTSILKTDEESVAMVKGPRDAKGYMLKKGTYIGENGGVVEEIISEERMTDLGKQLIRKVVIKEPFLDKNQKISYRHVELKMPGSFD
ncbi:MAG: pilus assembly protein PilP [Thermodesulfobacteriota bacterium]